MKSNDSPEIPDRGETSDIPGFPSWGESGEGRGGGERGRTESSGITSVWDLSVPEKAFACVTPHRHPGKLTHYAHLNVPKGSRFPYTQLLRSVSAKFDEPINLTSSHCLLVIFIF